MNAAQEADLREIGNYEVRFAAGLVLHLNGLRGSGRGGGHRAVGAVLGNSLSADRPYSERCKKGQNETECTNDHCKLPIHS